VEPGVEVVGERELARIGEDDALRLVGEGLEPQEGPELLRKPRPFWTLVCLSLLRVLLRCYAGHVHQDYRLVACHPGVVPRRYNVCITRAKLLLRALLRA
jgi:hypothetical protein